MLFWLPGTMEHWYQVPWYQVPGTWYKRILYGSRQFLLLVVVLETGLPGNGTPGTSIMTC